jgi:carbamoyl-phosphate synthase large subunit
MPGQLLSRSARRPAPGGRGVAGQRAVPPGRGRPALLEVNPRFPGTMPLTVASGVDMPLMALDSLRGKPLPDRAGFRDVAMVRYLDERFIDLGDVARVAA